MRCLYVGVAGKGVDGGLSPPHPGLIFINYCFFIVFIGEHVVIIIANRYSMTRATFKNTIKTMA